MSWSCCDPRLQRSAQCRRLHKAKVLCAAWSISTGQAVESGLWRGFIAGIIHMVGLWNDSAVVPVDSLSGMPIPEAADASAFGLRPELTLPVEHWLLHRPDIKLGAKCGFGGTCVGCLGSQSGHAISILFHGISSLNIPSWGAFRSAQAGERGQLMLLTVPRRVCRGEQEGPEEV